jgi:hypothetical protein
MGGQLTKEQASLPIAYVYPKDADRQSRILASSIAISNTPREGNEVPDMPSELNSHLPNVPNHVINPTNFVEMTSIRTMTTDIITPEEVMEDKPVEASHAEYYRSQACMAGYYGSTEIAHPYDASATEGLSAMLFSELPNLTNISLCRLNLMKLSPNICYLFATTKLQM